MNIVQDSKAIAEWLHTKIDGVAISNDEKTRAAAGCFDTALEHQVAISILIENMLYGSAFALARSVFEAYIRGMWLAKCATDKEVKDFLSNKFDRKFYELIADIEKLDGYSNGVLSKAKKAGWSILNGFTHTGSEQVLRRNTENYIEPDYTPEDINEIVSFVNSISLLAGLEITFLSKENKRPLQQEFLKKIKSYAEKP